MIGFCGPIYTRNEYLLMFYVSLTQRCHWAMSHSTERTYNVSLMGHVNTITSSSNVFASGYLVREIDHTEGH